MEILSVTLILLVGILNVVFYEYRVHRGLRDTPKTFDFTGYGGFK